MATIKFLVRNKNSEKAVTINYDIHISAKNRLRGATKSKILPKYWHEKNQRVRNISEISNTRDTINNKLSDFESFVYEKLNNFNIYDTDKVEKLLKEEIDIYFGKKIVEIEKIIDFYDFTKIFIEQSKSRIIEKTGAKLSIRTIQDYNKVVKLIEDFEMKNNYEITFQSINLEFYYAFINYLEKLNYSANTIGKFIKILKIFLNNASEQGYNQNFNFKNKHFIKPTVKSEQIYLNIQELERIAKLDLQDEPVLDNARNLFLIGAFTGLRVSDFNGLKYENIKTRNNKRMFDLTVKKTGQFIYIPLHDEVEKILARNNGNPPKKMNSQKINDCLSVLGKKAELDDLITINTVKGGKKLTKREFKYNLIKNHTARRSFCTNAYINGMPTLDIMFISGHSSEKTFLNYIKITAIERAIKIADNSFFKPNSKLKVV